MIRPLRQRHRRMVIVLGVFLPIAFAVGIAARKPVPSVTSLPMELVASPQEFAVTEWERADLFAKTPIDAIQPGRSYHAGGDTNPVLSIFKGSPLTGSVSGVPFQAFGCFR